MTESVVASAGASTGWGRRVLSVGDLVPRYGMLDGTWIVSVLLPLYFGVVNGDVGIALVMLALVLAAGMALRSRPKARLVTGVLGRAAVVAIVFGFLYGEFFNLSFGPVPLNRVETVSGFVGVAAVFFVAQLTANVAVGVMRSTGERRRGDAWAPAAHFAAFAGAAFVALAIVSLLDSLLTSAVESVITWLAIAELPEVAVLVVFYLVGAIFVAGAALLADVALARIDG